MKGHDYYFWIATIYVFMFCSVLSFVLYNYTELYGTVTVIEKQENILRQKSYSIPVRIELESQKLGTYTVLEEASIQRIWQSVHEIAGNSDMMPEVTDETDVPRLKGTIVYLNGTQETFQIGREFRFNRQV